MIIIAIPSLLALLFCISVLCYSFSPGKHVQRIFFFPEAFSQDIKSISRYIPSASGREGHVRQFVEELILGPHIFTHIPFFPSRTRILSLMYRDRAVYVNFSRDLAFAADSGISADIFELLKKNIMYNFPYVKDIHIFIDSYPVGELKAADAAESGNSVE